MIGIAFVLIGFSPASAGVEIKTQEPPGFMLLINKN